ncbi:hypothetical protein ACUOOS_24840, partial [Escherichia coli]
PAYGPQNDVTLKMPAFEWVHVQLHQQKGMISLSPPTICNSALYIPYENLNRVLRRSCYLTVSVPLCTAGLARQDETAAVCITRRQLHTVKCDQETGAEWQKGVG